jgi:hypothetical protein
MQQTQTRSIQTGDVPSALAGLPIVNVWYRGRSIGLYRVEAVDTRAVLLKHGVISFPVGTPLDVVDFQRVLPGCAGRRISTTVVDNTRRGIRLAW